MQKKHLKKKNNNKSQPNKKHGLFCGLGLEIKCGAELCQAPRI